jgi:hypothetical protein
MTMRALPSSAAFLGRAGLVAVERAVHLHGRDAQLAQRSHLVLHQRDQRRHHHRAAGSSSAGSW